ncbi:MAG: signal peptidase I [Acutalibacteraceae bacterium]|nr:signal peptidase I [Acutalibacteraceae bacterium]
MQQEAQAKTKQKTSAVHKMFTVIGAILCIVLIPMLVINVTLIVKSYTSPEKVPSFGGYLPMIVLTDSMYPYIESGDLVICSTTDPESIKVDDVISFFDPAGDGDAVITHRVIEVVNDEEGLKWRTKGDANNAEDPNLVPAENLVGIYNGFRIAGGGNVAMFMQTTPGLIVCVVVPLILLIGYDVIRRMINDKSKKKDAENLMKELEQLRAAQATAGADGAPATTEETSTVE